MNSAIISAWTSLYVLDASATEPVHQPDGVRARFSSVLQEAGHTLVLSLHVYGYLALIQISFRVPGLYG